MISGLLSFWTMDHGSCMFSLTAQYKHLFRTWSLEPWFISQKKGDLGQSTHQLSKLVGSAWFPWFLDQRGHRCPSYPQLLKDLKVFALCPQGFALAYGTELGRATWVRTSANRRPRPQVMSLLLDMLQDHSVGRCAPHSARPMTAQLRLVVPCRALPCVVKVVL